ncbi:MAG: class I SAM-dependent methyltransferase [Anaerolineae bacterium]|nr:class I SAM-dependent methyltransferase [Anaerolineae bacterium]
MSSAQKQGELWGQAASNWATLHETNHIPLFEAMLNAANVSKGTRFFDAGCGGGGASVLAAQRGAQISGLDAAEGLIEIARARVPLGEFRVGDIQGLPFENDAFDAVIAANSVQFADDTVAALRELRRVCTSTGRVVVALFGPPEKMAYRHIGGAVRAALPEPPDGKGPFELSAPGKLEGLMEQAGLQVIESSEVNCPFCYPDFEACYLATTSPGPMRRFINVLGEEKLKAVLWEAVQPFRSDDSRIEIGPNMFKYVVAVS